MANKELWGEGFESINSVDKTKKVLDKISKPKIVKKKKASKKLTLKEKLAVITENVYNILGKNKDSIEVITSKDRLRDYITAAIENGIIAIDTETNNSLDPMTAKIVGLAIYTPNNTKVYVPINHVDVDTRIRLENQLTEVDIKEELGRLIGTNVIVLMHNAGFDFQVLLMTSDIAVPFDWDTFLGAKLLNENEKANLETQYILHINPEQEKYSLNSLFEKQEYAIFPPHVFALYAAMDPYMTYMLYLYQKEQFEKPENKRIYGVFKHIEMPCISVVASMELTGVNLDEKYAKRLSNKYHKILGAIDKDIDDELFKLKNTLDTWRQSPEATYKAPKNYGDKSHPIYINPKNPNKKEFEKSLSEKLHDPINLNSPLQLSILLYDVLKVPVIDKSKPRGTGEDIIKQLDLPIARLILERRGIAKLLDTFIDALPKLLNEKDGKLHGSFNQYGAVTGRFSSSEPNLQNIPSKNSEIRLMFTASEGHVFVGADFSQQEPRLLAVMTQDDNMIKAYKDNKDLYATVAADIYHNNYEDNLETYPDGSPNVDGAKRRDSVKGIFLGIMYGRGVASVAETIGVSFQDAQEIINKFYVSYPKVKEWMDRVIATAKRTGYVEDLWGRRRRLPDLFLEPFEYTNLHKDDVMFNPYLGTKNLAMPNKHTDKYKQKLSKAFSRQAVDNIINEARKDKLRIKDNRGFIAQAERQCVNAIIQGSAASMTKIAMNKIHRDKTLEELGFKLLLTVHDELIGECPVDKQEEVAERLTFLMSTSISNMTDMPFKVSADISKKWYGPKYESQLKQTYSILTKTLTKEDALAQIYEDHSETLPEDIKTILEV